MPISSGRQSKVPMVEPECAHNLWASQTPSRLMDLRSPEMFRSGFIPGSYSVPDAHCWLAAQRGGLFRGRQIYLLADNPEQLQLCEDAADLDENLAEMSYELAGWFGVDALDEWRKVTTEIGHLEAINSETLSIRMAGWNTVVIEIADTVDGSAGRTLHHPAALRFGLKDLPLSLDGLPVETALCLSAGSEAVASFASSLLWNFGFHKLSYLAPGCWVTVDEKKL